MSARDHILGDIRRSLNVTGKEAPRLRVVADRMATKPKGVVPALGQVEGEARLALFRDKVMAASASFARVGSIHEVAAEIARHLRANNLPARLRRGSDRRLAALDFHGSALEVSEGPSEGDDLNGLVHAFAGVAETGTLALLSGPANPTTLNFLPDNAIALVAAGDVVGDLESLWAKLRAARPEGPERAINLVTGPSRSADIEQTLLLGAHGPRTLHVILVG
ncbi:MAG: LUD domain-containing protein [Rhodoblastus sp.]|nr:MAG: LUD domain-containing protein [Rhodoblastus sp.]